MKKNKLKLHTKIRDIKDWPKAGIVFKDMTPLLQDPVYFKKAIDELAKFFKGKKIDKVVGIDARGFLLASCIAYKLKAGLSIVRKKGKLPYKTICEEYDLEYGSSAVEMHQDAIIPGERVAIVDDLLATGGTAEAAAVLVEKLKGKIVGVAFLMELEFLKGKEKLKKYKVNSLIKY